MTRLLPLLLLVLPFAAQAQECSRETDEFTGKTTTKCFNEYVTVEEQPLQNISSAAVATITTDEASTIWVSVATSSESWNFIGVDTAHMLVDGARHELDAYRANSEVSTSSGNVHEQVVLNVPLTTAKMISQAGEVRVKIETAVFDLEPLVGQVQRLLIME